MTVTSQVIKQTKNISLHQETTACYHCGEDCKDEHILFDDKNFCCEGCKTVYEILNSNGLCQYYDLDENAGISLKGKAQAEYAYLDDPEVVARLIDFTDGAKAKITFYLPQIHCASCIWLLENLYKLSEGILDSKVNFIKKEIYITYQENVITLRKIVELLASIGYAPAISLSDLDENNKPVIDRSFYYKLGVAGFAFGNIMLLSFPEYLGLEKTSDEFFFRVFGYLNIALSLPVVAYSGRDYLRSAWLGLSQRNLNIDVPIALGIIVLFGRSVFEIITHTGAGFLDSLAGLIFFLLIGKWFQQKTYHNISFERDYKSYFPIAANKKTEYGEASVSLDKLAAGDVILIKHKELIPADSILLKGDAEIDYSFVTGEAEPVQVKSGEKIFAGGRQMAATIEVSLTRKVSQSYLTQLWNNEAFSKPKHFSGASRVANRVGKYFTAVILLIAFGALLYWFPKDSDKAINAFTAVLIIACPCAVALAIPFIFGNVLRILGKHELYLKNTSVIESLAEVNAVVFDKTGTITNRNQSEIIFIGEPLNTSEALKILALVNQSSHPISQQIKNYLLVNKINNNDLLKVEKWTETLGKGVQGIVNHDFIKIGSKSFIDIFLQNECLDDKAVYIQMNNSLRGYFQIQQQYRNGLESVINYFKNKYDIYLLSGDNDRERAALEPVFGKDTQLLFRQQPQDKLDFIKKLQFEHHKVLMIGDGLNDAGALQQSDAGIVITENTNNFTPACDGILHSRQFEHFPKLMIFAQKSIHLVYYAYALAFIYNVFGLSYAVMGIFTPVVAAILMPLSSVTVVLFGLISSNILARKILKT
ncbi:MAG: heavy metal translocating P-type ATPase metal-binding domain-containing protein [Saprospiraceae bacterium]|nr:heavy metal translocating P-type ATPase metal-binding domain-containing protein [Saprospiraceae bacterium]